MTPGPLLLAALLASAATPEDVTVRVETLISDPRQLASWLRDHSQELAAAAARQKQASADLGQARLPPNPSISATLSDVTIGSTNPPGLAFRDTAILTVSLSETLEIGKRGPRIASARLRLRSGHEAYLDALADVVARARLALGRVVYLAQRQSALDESLSSAQQMLELSRSRLEHGDLSGTDYDRLLVDTMVLEADVARNRADVNAALSACRAVLFATCESAGARIEILDHAPEIPSDSPDPGAPLARRPDVRVFELSRDSARQDATLARRRVIPDPALTVGYTHDKLVISGDQPKTLAVGVQLALPLFDRGQHDAAKAVARAAEADAQATALREQARADLAALTLRRASLESTLAGLQGRALATSKSVFDATLAAVNQGELGTTDLLLARRTYNDLALKVMDMQFEAFSVRNELRHALGLDADDIRTSEGDSWTH
jgi:outer membrane protein, heavy metal efflux system